ncbi:hypothetical protein [Flavobacterium sp. 140616W15]|uniref:hypothetical protein n=1 Tax=Flavobacterium sp. 140616W15 TaxID=2478552 RepID=UPI000F0C6B09|nr:hypothetical protein [Flavobacterium sp. 140616W15]AYN03748.1 hypothetical protein EAG11_05830 [Flavobacterium sp. 140616W15]
MYTQFNFFINLSWEKHIEIPNYLPNLFGVVNFARQHLCSLYYSKAQLDDFIRNCEDLDDNFITSDANKLDLILEGAEPVHKTSDAYAFSINFNNQHSFLEPVHDIYFRDIVNKEKTALISLNDIEKRGHYIRIRSNSDFEKLCFHFIPDTNSIIKWFKDDGEVRNFNLSPKHGENGKGQWQGESPLLCNKEMAQDYLNNSIADFKEKNRLFYFDDVHNKYLEFFYEGHNPQKQWHGFHVEQKNWKERVPSSIRKYYNRL